MTFDAGVVYTELQAHFRKRVRRDEPLAKHCTFGVGGPAATAQTRYTLTLVCGALLRESR